MIWFQVFLLTVCLEAFFIDDITVAMAFKGGLISESILILGSEQVKFIYSEKATKGPAAKNDTTENPGCFNQILSFESPKGSPVATF